MVEQARQQVLLDVSVPQPSGPRALKEFLALGLGSKERPQREDRGLHVLGFIDGRRIRHDGHHRLLQFLFRPEHAEGVVVALRHLAAVDPRNDRNRFEDARFRQLEDLDPVDVVEALGDVARHFNVLLLIAAHGHDVRVVHENVCGHQNRVGKEPVIRREALGHLVLVGVPTLQEPHGCHGPQNPRKLADLGKVGLAVEDRSFRIEAAGEIIERDVVHQAPAQGPVAHRGHRVEIRDEIDALALVLQLDVLRHRAEIVSQVALAGRRNPRKAPHRYSCPATTGVSQCAKAGSSPQTTWRKRCRSFSVTGPGGALPRAFPSTDSTGQTPAVVPVMKASAAP